MSRVSIAWLLMLFAGATFAAGPTRLEVAAGTNADGSMATAWHEVLQHRYGPAADDPALHAPKHATPEERAWHALVESRRGAWEAMVPEIAAPYAPVAPPPSAAIVLGNRGAEDAMTVGPARIAFDLSKLQSNYGDACTQENRARIDRFFRHEFQHVMQKAWLAAHPVDTHTPLQRAAFEMWTEGLGNRESLSPKWIDADGALSAHARKTLATLTPVMIERLQALRTATDAQAAVLVQDLSNGPFERKWGALPVALWLAEDAAKDPRALRRFVQVGPEGVWRFLRSRLPPDVLEGLPE
jgi:hypothetical protein